MVYKVFEVNKNEIQNDLAKNLNKILNNLERDGWGVKEIMTTSHPTENAELFLIVCWKPILKDMGNWKIANNVGSPSSKGLIEKIRKGSGPDGGPIHISWGPDDVEIEGKKVLKGAVKYK